jgi:hypothetical protein
VYFDGAAKRSKADDFYLFALQEAHLEQALDKRIIPVDGLDPRSLANSQLIKRWHRKETGSGRG